MSARPGARIPAPEPADTTAKAADTTAKAAGAADRDRRRKAVGVSVARRLLAVLPEGTLKVGAGLVVLGGASYVYLAIAGHRLSHAGYSSVSVLWAIVFSVGLGLFFPIEQEVTRLVAARRVTGGRLAPLYRRGAVLAVAVLLGASALMAAGAPWLARTFFDGDVAMVAMLAGSFAGLAAAHPTRGMLAGTGRFAAYSAQLGIDGGLRIVLAAALAAAGSRSPALFGLILTVAPLISVLATSGAVRAAITGTTGVNAGTAGVNAGTAGVGTGTTVNATAGIPAAAGAAGMAGTPAAATGLPDGMGWRPFLGGVVPLTVSTLLSQLLVNLSVIDVKVLAPTEAALAGALLSALVLARVPLFVFASLQASLLPGLARAATSGERSGFRRLVLRGCGIVTALAVAGGVPTVILGPWLIRVLFGVTASVLTMADFALMAVATGAYLLAQVLGQGVLALGRHRDQALAWVIGTAALIAVTVAPGGPKLRVEAAYLAGSVVVAVVLAIMVRRPPRVTPGSGGSAAPGTIRAEQDAGALAALD